MPVNGHAPGDFRVALVRCFDAGLAVVGGTEKTGFDDRTKEHWCFG